MARKSKNKTRAFAQTPADAEDIVIAQADPNVELNRVKEKKEPPAYQAVGDSSVRVSKAYGAMVEQRKSAALCAYELVREAWDEAYRYYNHNQVRDDAFKSQPATSTFRRGNSYENLVFSNTSVMIPAIYSKNPDVSFTTEQGEDKSFVLCLSKAVNALFNKKEPLGINLKPRMKKATLHTELTNFGVVKLDYTTKDESLEKANADMDELFKQLQKAKDKSEVREIEGKMQAIESNMEWMEPGGFKLKSVNPKNLIIDPAAENEDASDAMWMLELVFLPTDFLNAKFTKKDDEGRTLLYKPTHRVKSQGSGTRDDMLGLVLESINDGSEEKVSHTDEQRQAYIYENMTKCWYYWDRAQRRIFLFADNDWSWPLWAWEDDLKLSRFFPYFFIQFYPSTGGIVSPGEVTFYLDQQDEINEINKEISRARRIAFNVLMYNNNKVKRDDVRKILDYLKDGIGDNVLGIDVPEGQSIKDVIETLTPPSMKEEVLFNKAPIYSSIDRLSSVSDALRGSQFKTNTTEDAVQAYVSAAQLRVSNRTDAIEECVGEIAWAISELLVQNADRNYIAGLVGDRMANDWKNMSVRELNANYSVLVAAGSSEKPTSSFKKKEAIQVAQSLGQFATAAPGATLRVVLKLLRTAFTEIDINDDDWNALDQEIQANLQRGVSTGASSNGDGAMRQQLEALPPEAKAKIMEDVKRGVPPQEAIKPFLGDKSNGTAQPA